MPTPTSPELLSSSSFTNPTQLNAPSCPSGSHIGSRLGILLDSRIPLCQKMGLLTAKASSRPIERAGITTACLIGMSFTGAVTSMKRQRPLHQYFDLSSNQSSLLDGPKNVSTVRDFEWQSRHFRGGEVKRSDPSMLTSACVRL